MSRNRAGYTLVELVIVIVIIGILATTAMRSMRGISDVNRTELTRQKLDRLAKGIVGDPEITAEGTQLNFGYVGDVGSLPPNLDALVQNPGSYSTWHGPYVRDEFTSGGADYTFKKDAWGKDIVYAGGVTLVSNGGGTAITRNLANAASVLLRNKVTVVVTDLNHNTPGAAFKDSVRLLLSFPDGSGGVTTRSKNPDKDGRGQFDSIPIGLQTLRVVYSPANDTLTRRLSVVPGANCYSEVSLYRKVW